MEISGCNTLGVQFNLVLLSRVQLYSVQLKGGADESGAKGWVESHGCK